MRRLTRTPKKLLRAGLRRKRSLVIGGAAVLIALFIINNLVAFAENGPDTEPLLLTTSIDPVRRTIAEDAPIAPSFDKEQTTTATLWNAFDRSGMRAALLQTYRSITRPGTKVIVVHAGLRKEEIADLFASKLSWDEEMRADFLALTGTVPPARNKTSRTSAGLGLPLGQTGGQAGAELWAGPGRATEGYLYPDTYYMAGDAGPEAVHEALATRFTKNVSDRYASETAQMVSIELALKIASLIQREAAGPHDMRLVSGVIWNRLFRDMTLDLDATLQYAKGNKEIGWWPRVVSEDKYLDSPFNTYRHGGLPPTAIANPSVAAIYAALNPEKTDALFYLHDPKRNIRLARTYKEHLANIRQYY